MAELSNTANPADLINFMFKSQVTEKLLVWASLFALISTARKSNGYRGVHDLLSKCRVVRLAGDLESQLLDQFAVTVPMTQFESQAIGDYELIGSYGRNDKGQEVFLGRDTKLDRPVWLFRGFDNEYINSDRRHLTRPCRLRIINQSNNGDSWYATESAPGLPFIEVVRRFSCMWKSACPLFRDVVYELSLAAENDTIPPGLTIDHVWLDHAGSIRLLDHRVVASQRSDEVKETNSRVQAVNIMLELLRRYMQLQDHPASLMQLTDELERKQNDADVFDWLVSKLNESIDQRTTWNWIDRAGMSAITFGVEFSFLFFLVFSFSFLVGSFGFPIQICLTVVSAYAIVGAYGFFFNGGPAMRLSNVLLCSHASKKRVSAMMASVRNAIAWTPTILILGMGFAMIYGGQKEATLIGVDFTDSSTHTWGWLLLFLMLLAVFGFMFFAILNPRRGVPEYVTGTRLMRK